MLGNRDHTIALVTVAIALTACSGWGETAEPSSSPPDLDGTRWVLASLNGESLVEDSNITLNFADGNAGGYSGCNAYGGEYTTEGDTLTIPGVAQTHRTARSRKVLYSKRRLTWTR